MFVVVKWEEWSDRDMWFVRPDSILFGPFDTLEKAESYLRREEEETNGDVMLSVLRLVEVSE